MAAGPIILILPITNFSIFLRIMRLLVVCNNHSWARRHDIVIAQDAWASGDHLPYLTLEDNLAQGAQRAGLL